MPLRHVETVHYFDLMLLVLVEHDDSMNVDWGDSERVVMADR